MLFLCGSIFANSMTETYGQVRTSCYGKKIYQFKAAVTTRMLGVDRLTTPCPDSHTHPAGSTGRGFPDGRGPTWVIP